MPHPSTARPHLIMIPHPSNTDVKPSYGSLYHECLTPYHGCHAPLSRIIPRTSIMNTTLLYPPPLLPHPIVAPWARPPLPPIRPILTHIGLPPIGASLSAFAPFDPMDNERNPPDVVSLSSGSSTATSPSSNDLLLGSASKERLGRIPMLAWRRPRSTIKASTEFFPTDMVRPWSPSELP